MNLPLASAQWAGRFGRFAVVGLLATATQYLVLVVGVEALGATPVRASALGFVFGAVVGYLLNRSYTFRSDVPHLRGAMRFGMVALVGLAANILFMTVLIRHLQAPYLLAQLFTTGVVLFWNFVGNALWTFGRR